MAEINEAWSVLGDPERRAAYDRQVRGSRAPAEQRTPRYGPANPPPEHQPVAPIGCVGSFAGAAPWLAIIVVLVAIFVFTAYADDGSELGRGDPGADRADVEDDPMVEVRDVRGMCIQVVRGTPNVVDCFTRPNEGRIVALASPGAQCPDGTTEWLVPHQGVLACTEENGSNSGSP